MIVDFKFGALVVVSLRSDPPVVGLVEKLTGRLYWWEELCVPSLHRHSLIIPFFFILQCKCVHVYY